MHPGFDDFFFFFFFFSSTNIRSDLKPNLDTVPTTKGRTLSLQ